MLLLSSHYRQTMVQMSEQKPGDREHPLLTSLFLFPASERRPSRELHSSPIPPQEDCRKAFTSGPAMISLAQAEVELAVDPTRGHLALASWESQLLPPMLKKRLIEEWKAKKVLLTWWRITARTGTRRERVKKKINRRVKDLKKNTQTSVREWR